MIKKNNESKTAQALSLRLGGSRDLVRAEFLILLSLEDITTIEELLFIDLLGV